ncbi:MAG: U32 family peptidase [Desulfobacterales bacterium]|nr:U32 family peptidase [Desulfobacterales bacterium]
MTIALELLAPAGNAQIGTDAIDHGADAVYIGAPRFGARAAAGNPLNEIAALVRHAHLFAAKVYVALNTILTDKELPEALTLIRQIHAAGADGLIIQDVGLLECDLPPIPIIASTQMHNASPEKVKFLEQVGFHRVILARELSLAEIRAIREQTAIELECFVHGALCVSYSGQCYMSQALAGRSGNRGVCAQPCRHCYTLTDGDGKPIVENKYLLSLKDLNLAGAIADLVAAGITSFKIEGRYKDAGYVKNVTAAFRQEIDRFIADTAGYRRASSGRSELAFTPDLSRTFNRGHTRYFLEGRGEKVGAIDTPKSLGKAIGTVTEVGHGFFRMKGERLRNGDGLCFFASSGNLSGLRVERVEQERIYSNTLEGLSAGQQLYRNRDHEFLRTLEKASAKRRVGVSLRFRQSENEISLEVMDEDGHQARASIQAGYAAPQNPEAVRRQTESQLSALGNTIYRLEALCIQPEQPGFLPLSTLNRLRREALEHLTRLRLEYYRAHAVTLTPNSVPYPEKLLDYRANVLNRKAEQFYRRHGATVAEPALESGTDPAGKRLMTTRYCIRHQLDACPKYSKRNPAPKEPLCLSDGKRKYRLAFDCRRCEMHVDL